MQSWDSQEDMMPGFDHADNSEITALVTSDPLKAKELGKKKYDVEAAFATRDFRKWLS